MKGNFSNGKIISLREFGDLLGIPKNTLRYHRSNGLFPALMIGRTWAVNLADPHVQKYAEIATQQREVMKKFRNCRVQEV